MGKIIQEIVPIVSGRGGGTDASKLGDALVESYKSVEQDACIGEIKFNELAEQFLDIFERLPNREKIASHEKDLSFYLKQSLKI